MMVSENVPCLVCGVGAQESAAEMVNRKLPKPVGVPLSRPLVAIEIPAGKMPDADQRIGKMPPADISWSLYGEFCVPLGNGLVDVIENAGQVIVMLNTCEVLVLVESVTVTVKLKVPADVGVPDKLPADESARPAGNVPAVTAHV